VTSSWSIFIQLGNICFQGLNEYQNGSQSASVLLRVFAQDWDHTNRHIPRCKSLCNPFQTEEYPVEPGYNDIGLYDTPYIASDILWYQLIPRC